MISVTYTLVGVHKNSYHFLSIYCIPGIGLSTLRAISLLIFTMPYCHCLLIRKVRLREIGDLPQKIHTEVEPTGKLQSVEPPKCIPLLSLEDRL